MNEVITNTIEKPLHEIIEYVDSISYLQTESDIPYQTPLIIGKPGGGKTMSIEYLAKKKDDEFFSSHFALMTLEELGGIPQFNSEIIQNKETLTTVWSLPEFVSTLYKKSDIAKTKQFGGVLIKSKINKKIINGIPHVKDFTEYYKNTYKFNNELEEFEIISGDNKPHRVILLLDDIHRCDVDHQTALIEILSEKKIKGYKFPKNVAIILAGNFTNISGFKGFLSPVVNRCMFLHVSTDFNYWKKNYALKNNVHPVIIAFLSAFPNYFHMDEENSTPWASPRAWTNFSNILTLLEQENKNKKLPLNTISYFTYAHLGNSVSEKFTSFYSLFNEFETNEIFNTVNTSKDFFKYIDKYEYNKQYSLAYACINYFIQNYNNKTKNKLLNTIKCIIEAYKSNNSNKNYAELGLTVMKEIVIIFNANSSKYDINDFLSTLVTIDDDGNTNDLLIDTIDNTMQYIK